MDKYQITIDSWNKAAEIYQEKFMYIDLYNDTYDSFCESIAIKNASILEIGCGPGCITKYIHSKRPDFIIDATDVSFNMIQLGKMNLPDINFSVLDARNIITLTSKYNGILCGFCLPYLSKEDTEKLIFDTSNLLDTNGKLYISWIEDDYSKSGMITNSLGDISFVYYHELNYLLDFLKKANFKLLKQFRKKYPNTGKSHSTHFVIIAEKIS